MQWIANILMTVGVSLGCYGAVTAYHAPIDAPDAELNGLVLNADAGARLNGKGTLEPIAKSGQELDPSLLAELRQNAQSPPAGASALEVSVTGALRVPTTASEP